MINFVSPKSLLWRRRQIYLTLAVFIFAIGAYLLYASMWPLVFQASATADLPHVLPDNPTPPAEILNQFRLPKNETVERIVTPAANPQPTNHETNHNKLASAKTVTIKKTVKSRRVPNKNWIKIPKMGVDAEILEGKVEEMLWKGVVRMSVGSTPDQGGNTIITAHRYLYRPPDPRTFFLLDKLEPGDIITIYWENKEYKYKVRESKVVNPDQIEILYNTPNAQLTLFSCTPLFTSLQRLVVIADLID